MEWQFDELASMTYPLYSRAVLGDLCPDPVTPLTATVGVGAELGPAWANVYAQTGLRPLPEGTAALRHLPVAMFGGYLYLNTSLLRLFGINASGADPMAFAQQYLGERRDVPRQRDERPSLDTTAESLQSWTQAALSGAADRQEHARAGRRLAELRATRPKLADCSAEDLVARLRSMRGELRESLRLFTQAELATAVTNDLLTRISEDAGHPGGAGALLAGRGGAVTDPVERLWRLARQVTESGKLGQLFDRGLGSLASELDAARNGDLGRLRGGLLALLAEHGHVGPAEWELSGQTWATDSRLLLGQLDVLRRASAEGDQADPATRSLQRADRGTESVALIRRSLSASPVAAQRFEETWGAAGRWLLARRRIRQIASALHHEQRLAARELGRRQVASGLLDDVDQIFMLLEAELDEFAADPVNLAETLHMRAYDYHAIATYQPPFVTVGQPPPVVRWPKGSTAKALAGRRALTGTGAAHGAVTGPATVPRSPGTPGRLRTGDVLVVGSGGPCWLPLLPVAAAVVVDAGAPLSEVAVACRDLAIPCVVATVDATTRIGQGATVEVDGFSGTVRLAGRESATPGSRNAHPPSDGRSPTDGQLGGTAPIRARQPHRNPA
jgi:pyruvate,water dikinase